MNSTILQREKVQGSRSFEVLGRPTGIPKGLEKRKIPKGRGEGGLAILEFRGQGGNEHFGISEGKGGGVKILMPTVVGCGYFLESPIVISDLLNQKATLENVYEICSCIVQIVLWYEHPTPLQIPVYRA